jgi:hypothetical protein
MLGWGEVDELLLNTVVFPQPKRIIPKQEQALREKEICNNIYGNMLDSQTTGWSTFRKIVSAIRKREFHFLF